MKCRPPEKLQETLDAVIAEKGGRRAKVWVIPQAGPLFPQAAKLKAPEGSGFPPSEGLEGPVCRSFFNALFPGQLFPRMFVPDTYSHILRHNHVISPRGMEDREHALSIFKTEEKGHPRQGVRQRRFCFWRRRVFWFIW